MKIIKKTQKINEIKYILYIFVHNIMIMLRLKYERNLLLFTILSISGLIDSPIFRRPHYKIDRDLMNPEEPSDEQQTSKNNGNTGGIAKEGM